MRTLTRIRSGWSRGKHIGPYRWSFPHQDRFLNVKRAIRMMERSEFKAPEEWMLW